MISSLGLAGCLLGASAAAHDFWLQPRSFNVAVGAPDPITIEVGHGPFRSRWSGNTDRVVLFRNLTPTVVDLKGVLHPTPDQDAILSFSRSGTQVLAFESNDALSSLPSIRYNDYAKVEGLTPALAYRARTGATDKPGRESYSRRCKALIQVGPAGGPPNPAVTRPIGLTLEIVPDISPYALAPGQALPVHVLYEGRPLAGALVKLTNLEFDVRPAAMHLTDSAGRASFDVPRTGDWLLNVIWTKPIKGNPAADFETTFSSLTFGYSRAPMKVTR